MRCGHTLDGPSCRDGSTTCWVDPGNSEEGIGGVGPQQNPHSLQTLRLIFNTVQTTYKVSLSLDAFIMAKSMFKMWCTGNTGMLDLETQLGTKDGALVNGIIVPRETPRSLSCLFAMCGSSKRKMSICQKLEMKWYSHQAHLMLKPWPWALQPPELKEIKLFCY